LAILSVGRCAVQELHEPYLVKEMLKTAISSYREEQEETCDITARSVASLGTGGGLDRAWISRRAWIISYAHFPSATFMDVDQWRH